MKFTVIVLLALLPLFQAASISQFILINRNTGSSRALQNNSIVRIRRRHIITAVISEDTRSVTFTSPSLSTTHENPFTFDPAAHGLRFGPQIISAFPNQQHKRHLSIHVFFIPRGFTRRGPLPTPTGSELADLPLVTARCRGSTRLSVTDVRTTPNFSYGGIVERVYARVRFCNRVQSMRIRYIDYTPNRNGDPALWGIEYVTDNIPADGEIASSELLLQSVGDEFFFIEACMRQRDGTPLCATSDITLYPSRAPAEPLPVFRPPIELRVAPGDTASLTYSFVENEKFNSPFRNGAGNIPGKDVFLQARLQRRSGSLFQTFSWERGPIYTVNLFGKRGASRKLRGGTVNIKHSRARRRSITDDDPRISTRILVSNISSLVKQDTSLPTFRQPKYNGPEVDFGDPAEITVRANNSGGGRRANGRRPSLHYQWYIRRADDYYYTTYAEPIPGATNATLKEEKVSCDFTACTTLYGCYGMARYYVDVCNTFGCRRSEEIVFCEFD